jgi:hypothetical protein
VTTSRAVTCSWRPSIHGAVSLSAVISSITLLGYTGAAKANAITSKRSNSR